MTSRCSTISPFVIAIAGGSASGKSTLVRKMVDLLGPDRIAVLEFDRYYLDQSAISLNERVKQNYDHPHSLEFPLIESHLRALRLGQEVFVPHYDYALHTRASQQSLIKPLEFLIVDGFLALYDPTLRSLFDHSVFVDTPADIRFARRLERDIRERGRTPASVRSQWESTVQPMHLEFCEPTKAHADQVIDGSAIDAATVESVLELLPLLQEGSKAAG